MAFGLFGKRVPEPAALARAPRGHDGTTVSPRS
jgi:hypothetical protein